jgi:mannose-6-phosphate isomerase-like protein (cupin superfamily)
MGDASFSVLATAHGLQAASMILAPGESSGEKGNEHPKSEQLLLVLEGSVVAEVDGKTTTLKAGDFVIVPRESPHVFRNVSSEKAVTFNVYAPPAY